MQSNYFDLSPLQISQEQQVEIQRSILNEESMSHIEIELKGKQSESAIFLEDSPAEALMKLKCFSELVNKERLAYAQRLADTFELIGEDAFRNLGFILGQFWNDSYSVQVAILNQMTRLVALIKRRQSGYIEMREHVLPFLSQFFAHQDYDIKVQVAQLIASILPYLDENDRVELVLSKLVDLAHDEINSQNRQIAAEIMGDTAQVFGQNVCESYICGELLSLGTDLQDLVRQKAILQLPKIAVALSQKYIEQKLLPFFQDKCQESVLCIRQACIEVFSGICKYSSHKVKIQLIPQYIEFLSDQKREARRVAYENLGLFISSIRFQNQDQEQLDILLVYYSNMMDKQVNNLVKDNDMVYFCSFYFPAVLQAIGKERWLKLKNLYNNLIRYPSEKVKKTTACGFHEIAKILGPEIARDDLVPILETLVQDKQQEVRNAVVLNLPKFISIFDINEREYVIDVLLNVKKDQHKWRTRLSICISIFPLSKCFLPETVFFVIAPILFKMCSDTAASVRKKASKNVIHLISPFVKGSQELSVIVDQIKAFSLSKRFNQRQSYCWMCYKLFNLKEFEEYFLERFIDVCSDNIDIVRISALIVIDRYIQKVGFSKERKYLKYLILQFKEDRCTEIMTIMNKYEFIVQKPRNKSLSISKSSSSSELKELPEFDTLIENIRKGSIENIRKASNK